MATSPLDVAQLQNAFEIFNQQSGLLEESYRDLQDTVESLTCELRTEQSARLTELVKKERLGRRLSELMETLPGAILVIDGSGIVLQQNSQASALLNQPLIGCSWADIVRREVREGGSEDGNIQLRDGRWLSLSRRPLTTEPGEVLLRAKAMVSGARQGAVLNLYRIVTKVLGNEFLQRLSKYFLAVVAKHLFDK